MKIGLISPSKAKITTYYSNNPQLRKFFLINKQVPAFFSPNLALLTIAGLAPKGDHITLVDERIDDLTFKEDFDIVGISMITAQARRGYEIANQYRKRGIYTVLGGIHPTICSEEASQYADTLILGEAENTWPQLLEDFKSGKPKKVYRDSGVDITKSPIPRYDLVNKNIFHILPIQTTRGCPRDCSFCTVKTVFGAKYRIKTTDQIVSEVEAAQRVAESGRCIFNDDNMFVNRKRTREILDAIKPLKVRYFSETDISVADDDFLLKQLQESGCVTLFIGFESLIPENLASIDKDGWKLKQSRYYSEKCKKIQSYGIQVLGSFMVGLDYDTRDNLLKLMEFVLESNIWAQFLFVTPFPGTRIRDEFMAQGRLAYNESNWDLYTCFDAIVEPPLIKMNELNETVLEMYKSVYSETAHRKRTRYMIDQIKLYLRRSSV
jgi:radical SAM superfamily enzyme YgiQ (UPF0313 family)